MSASTFYYDAKSPTLCRKAWQPKIRFVERTLGLLTLVVSFGLVMDTFHLTSPFFGSMRSVASSVEHPETLQPRRIACHPHDNEVLSDKCVFDEMLNGWVPVECYDEELGKDALRNDTQLAMMGGAGHFPWYSDLNFTSPISSENLPNHLLKPSANMTAYTLEKWHVAHCLYVWRLGLEVMNRIDRGGKRGYVNTRVLDAGHVNHCNRVIANQDHRQGAKATVTFGYGTCVLIT